MHDQAILAIVVVAPFMLPILLMVLLNKRHNDWKTALTKVFELTVDGLLKQQLFWLSIFIPLIYFVVFGIICWTGYTVNITELGFRTFITISALPLALLSMAIPFGVAVARFHSTEQTARQIKQAGEKNNLDAFYSHRKEFFAYFEKIPEAHFLDAIIVKYDISPRLHSRFFKGSASDGTPKLDMDLTAAIILRLNAARVALADVITAKDESLSYERYAFAAFNIYWLAKQVGAREISSHLYKNSYSLCIDPAKFDSEYTIHSLGRTTEEAIAAFRIVKSYMINILEFAGEPKMTAEVYAEETSLIDISNGFLYANSELKFIEYAFSDVSGPLWETFESRKLAWFETQRTLRD